MVPERIPGTLTTSSSSPMDSCGRDPICRPSEPRFLSSKASFTTMIAVAPSPHNRNFTIRMGQPPGRLARNGIMGSLAGLVMGSRLAGSDRDCSRLTGYAEVVLILDLPLLPAWRLMLDQHTSAW